MFDIVLNASLVFFGIEILKIIFGGRFFVLKLYIVCLHRYHNYNFSGIFQNFL